MGKVSRSIESRIKNSSLNNQHWFYSFGEFLKNKGENDDSISQYNSAIIRLIEFSKNKEIQDIPLEVIKEFLFQYDKPKTMTNNVNFIKKYFTFLVNQKVRIGFNVNELNDYRFTPKELEKENTRKPIPLTFDEIIELRSLLKSLERYEQWLTFELIYQFGLRYKDLPELTQDNYDSKNSRFNIKKFEKQTMPEIIIFLINMGGLPKKKYRFTAFDYRIKEVSKLIGKEILWKDIIKTREQNFFKCPKCNEIFENTPDNWVIFEYEIDRSKWIVCKKNCSLGVKINEQN